LWSQLQIKLPKFFEGLEIIPALMHGDLWGGNAGETKECPGNIEKQIVMISIVHV